MLADAYLNLGHIEKEFLLTSDVHENAIRQM